MRTAGRTRSVIDECTTGSLSERKATCRAGSNIAFIKYWGVAAAGEDLNIPLNNSISMTLADAHTTTTVAWDDGACLPEDTVAIDGVQLQGAPAERIVAHLDRLRALAGVPYKARVVSNNNFPMASGIASSASGFAALTVAGAAALGLRLNATRLSSVARQGSGSASRSLFGGYVEWERGWGRGESESSSLLDSRSVAHQMHDESHWALRDVIAIVSTGAKRVSSSSGHRLAATSPLNAARTRCVSDWLKKVRRAIAERDLSLLGPVLELDALAMHGVMMTSTPSLLYWQSGTLEVLQAVRSWREDEGVPVYFTIDAGPNVHLICEADSAAEVERRVGALPEVERVLTSGPGTGSELLDGHLF
ncbi:MAG: diphosphomevalonate decarboxylase [Caldilineaceae bacterium SB0664_bin_27]|uniref:diphosphomevalonate decarboxylase n=1 Tax=Caldilineaceae bacterium SB0664_bin_27 TaxID=2605260 RepID=A0A6B0YVS3_9CHLR|nr:diphosphomevalonate decarboxylase [Caldilineaceae bacterium SB0664_bin_27]